jgi:hypothetical protein
MHVSTASVARAGGFAFDLLRTRKRNGVAQTIAEGPGADTAAGALLPFLRDADSLPPWQQSARKAKSAVSAFLHFQPLEWSKMAVLPCTAGNAE